MLKQKNRYARIAPLLVVLLGFAVRVWAMDTAWIDGDRANPHGLGLVALDTASSGDWPNFPLFSDEASVGLPNPPLLTYAYALAALTGRSLSMANALGLIANTITVAAAFGIGRRMHSWSAGMLAATLVACSNWGVYLARGTWHPTPIEPGVALSAFLLLAGLTRQRARLLISGFVVAAATAFSYLAAFVILAQAPFAVLVAGGLRRGLRSAFLRGVSACVAAVVLYVLLLAAGGRLGNVGSILLLRPEQRVYTTGDLLARDITPVNRNPSGHFLRLATNDSYALTWTNPALPGFALRLGLENAQSAFLTLAALAGFVLLAWRFRKASHRFLLAWGLLPVAVLYALVLNKPYFQVAPYYLLFASPVVHVLAAIAIATALKRLRQAAAVTVALCALLTVVPVWNFVAAAQSVYQAPFNGNTGFMPLRWSQRLGRLWRDECAQMTIDDHWWMISLRESSLNARRGVLRQNKTSLVWAIRPEGGTCALQQNGPALPNATLLPLMLDDGSAIRTYRALPYDAPADFHRLTVNLGWTLLDHRAPPRAAAGETITLTHVWRVEELPNEPHAFWYFAPYAKLLGPAGQVVADFGSGSAIEGWAWRPGDIVMSSMFLALPAGLPAGDYTLQSALFDPNQKKNAVYFDPASPTQPILPLTRTLRIAGTP